MKNTTGIVRILFFTACSNAQPEIFAHTLSQCRLEAGGKFLEGFFSENPAKNRLLLP
ncbi:MAG: hypothetical protein M0Q26_09710 [Chitinophagaceae bacterium]|nr:hypothetical protein [Chitinophagaceae bacterium]